MFKKNKQKIRSRNRQPIAQSRPTSVFSYYNSGAVRPNRTEEGKPQARKQEASGAPYRRPKKQPLRKLAGVILIAGCAVLVVSSLVVVPQPQVKVLGDKNSQFFLQDNEVYRSAAQQIISSTPLNRNKMTFNAADISKKMRQVFPELSAVSVSLPLVGWEPTVYVQAFSPSLVLVDSASGDFVLDPDGRAFTPGSLRGSLDKLKVPIVRDQSGLQIDERKVALPSNHVSFITEVHRQLLAKNIEITGITLPAGDGELEVQVRDKPYVIRFNLYGDAREGAGRYLATRSYLESRGQSPNDYIDVRVDGRVFYK